MIQLDNARGWHGGNFGVHTYLRLTAHHDGTTLPYFVPSGYSARSSHQFYLLSTAEIW